MSVSFWLNDAEDNVRNGTVTAHVYDHKNYLDYMLFKSERTMPYNNITVMD